MPSIILSDNGVSSGSAGIKTTGGNDGVLALQTTTSGGTATTAVTIDTSQNVGVGVTNPSVRLHAKTGSSGALSDSRYIVTAEGGAEAYLCAAASGFAGIRFPNASSASQAKIDYTHSTNSMEFGANNAERMRIDSSGNLLVGKTTEASANVGFAANPTAGFRATTTSGNYNICNVASATGTESIIQIRYSDVAKGGIGCTSTAVQYNTTSDYRLKENPQPMVGALQTISQLKPCTYTWKFDGSNGQGFIAHELQEVVPECVSGEKDAVDADGSPVYQGIDTSFLVATLTAAIQEQQALITTLTERISALENK
jgi:hypothetical protein